MNTGNLEKYMHGGSALKVLTMLKNIHKEFIRPRGFNSILMYEGNNNIT